jgi:hypothetical protein
MTSARIEGQAAVTASRQGSAALFPQGLSCPLQECASTPPPRCCTTPREAPSGRRPRPRGGARAWRVPPAPLAASLRPIHKH